MATTKNHYDYSDLATDKNSSTNYDYSDLAEPSASESLINQAQNQATPPWWQTMASKITSGLPNNNLLDPNTLMRTAASGFNPINNLQMAAQSAGKVGSALNPELMESPGIIPGIVNSLGRIGTGTATTTAMNAPNINSIQDLKNNLKSNLKLNTLIEAPANAIRTVGGLAELFNPAQYAEKQRNLIEQGAKMADAKRQAAYAPVNAKYNDKPVTNDPKNYLDFDENESQYFSPNVKKVIKTFNNDPTFNNLHNMQSLMGNEAANISNIPEKNHEYQALNNSRNSIKDKIVSFLSNDPQALAQYKKGEQISRDEYYPYKATPQLAAAAEGRKTDFNPNKMVKEVNSDLDRKSNFSIPKDHPVVDISKDLENRISRGQVMQYAVPMAAGTAMGTLLHPSMGHIVGGIGGALSGAGFAHYLESSIFNKAQEPWLQNVLQNLSHLYYGGLRNSLSNWRGNNS